MNRIQQNQQFLLRLLNLHIGSYFPIRQWLGIDYKGRIDVISHLSYGYISDIKKDNIYITRVYQQPDLGYKLNLVLDNIPEVLVPRFGQPSWGLLQMRLARCATATYQPSIESGHIKSDNTGAFSNTFCVGKNTDKYVYRGLIKWNLTDLSVNTTFTDATITLCDSGYSGYANGYYLYLYRLLRTDWTTGATWNTYNGTNNWTTAGGDYTTTNYKSVACAAKGDPPSDPPSSDYYMNVTSAQSLIQDCFDNQSREVHLEIIHSNESQVKYQWVAGEDYSITAARPKLVVTYSVSTTSYSTVALSSTLQHAGYSTTALLSTLEKAGYSTTALLSTLEKYQVNTTALSSLLEKQGKSPVAFTSLLEKSQSVTTAIQSLLEALKKDNVALTSQLEQQLKTTTALWTDLDRLGVDTVALYSLLEKLTQATLSLQSTLEKCKSDAVALNTFLQYEKVSPVAIQSTFEKALKITAAFQSTLEKVLTETVSFQSTLEGVINNTVALTTKLEDKKISNIAIQSVLERVQQNTTALLSQLEYARETTTALYSTLEATKINTVALYTDLNYVRTQTLAINTELEWASRSTIALRTLFEKTMQSTTPLISVLRPYKVIHPLHNFDKHSGLLDNFDRHTSKIHNIKKL